MTTVPRSTAAARRPDGRPDPPKRARFDDALGRYLGKPVDFFSSIITLQKQRLYCSPRDDPFVVQPSEYHGKDMLTSSALIDQPAITSVCTNWVHSYNGYRKRSPVLCCLWTPEGRRLLTGNKSGEVAVLNGFAFNALHQFSAHAAAAVQSMVWAREGDFMLTGSPDGWVNVWQSSMVSVKEKRCHDDAVRQISISPTDSKFATASDDGSLKVWDLETITLESQDANFPAEALLSGHGNKVTCCDWHPRLSLLASGSQDKLVKLWDPRIQEGRTNHCLTNYTWHRNTVLKVKWNPKISHQLLSCGKDYAIKLTDIRMMQELYTFEGHKKDVTCIDWHPHHPDLFVSGCADGSIYWIVGHKDRSEPGALVGVNTWTNASKNHGKEVCRMVAEVTAAHAPRQVHQTMQTNPTVWDLKWHPLGHMLASVGNDIYCKIWGRAKPGQAEDTKEVRPAAPAGAGAGYLDDRPPPQFRGTSTWNRYQQPMMLRPGMAVDNRPLREDAKMVVTFNDEDD